MEALQDVSTYLYAATALLAVGHLIALSTRSDAVDE